MLCLEAVVEALGDSLDVECGAGALRHVDERERCFFVEAEGDRIELL